MGIARGTNVVNDNLILGYDSGYSVADPRESTRFYKGKPTTNIASGAAFIHDTASGSAGSCVDAPEKGPGWKKVTITAIGTNFRVIQFGSYPTMTANVTYASSFEVDWGNMRGKGYALTQDGSGGGTRNYFTNGSYASGVTGVTINSSLLNGHIGMNITKTANHVHVPFIYNYNTSTSGRNDYFYYKEYQQEVGTIPTPYVDGTRSATASLIDLKRTTDINLSNISFNSLTGQPQYDGTDDYIDLASNPQIGDTQASWEFVVKFHQTHDDDTSTYRQLYIQESSVWIAQYYDKIGIDIHKDNNNWFDTNGGVATGSQIGPVDANIWYHAVFTFNNGVMKGYLNGVLGFTTTKSGMTQGIKNGQAPRRIGRRSNQPLDGDMPVVRLYDTDLSAEQVVRNYNAYKNRFNT